MNHLDKFRFTMGMYNYKLNWGYIYIYTYILLSNILSTDCLNEYNLRKCNNPPRHLKATFYMFICMLHLYDIGLPGNLHVYMYVASV